MLACNRTAAARPLPITLAVRTALAAGLLVVAGCSSNNDDTGPAPPGIATTMSTRVAMRDGVELYTEILLPADAEAVPVPTLLLRTPYDLPTLPLGGLTSAQGDDEGDEEDGEEDPALTRAAWAPVLERGYAVVFQNLRGTQASGGRNALFANEREDGVDTVDWIHAQPWSNGRVGAIGDSAAGFSVHLLAAARPEGLDATFAQVSCGDLWDSAVLPEHGGLKLETFLPFMLGQSLETGDEHLASLGIGDEAIGAAQAAVGDALGALFGDDPGEQFAALTVQPFIDYPGVSTLLPAWREVLDDATRGDRAACFDTRGESAVPGLHVTLWQDVFVECALGDFQALADGSTEQNLLVLDGSHYEIDDAETWPVRPMLDWFDRHLKDVATEPAAPVRYAVQSVDSAETASRTLVETASWPPADAIDRAFYLDAGGALSDGLPAADAGVSILADPDAPTATAGGRHLIIDAGVAEQPPLEGDGTTAVFATAPFDAGATIAGEVRLDTVISADVADADLHARLVERTADGRRVLVVAGMQRARFRDGALAPMDLVPGEAVPLALTLGNIAHRVAPGSRLQLELTASDFPAWDLNPQTGGSAFTATDRVAGTITVRLSPVQPSRLTLPLLP